MFQSHTQHLGALNYVGELLLCIHKGRVPVLKGLSNSSIMYAQTFGNQMSKVFQSLSKIKVGSNQDKDTVIMKASSGCSAVTRMRPDISSTKVCLTVQLASFSFHFCFFFPFSPNFLSNLNPATNEKKKTHLPLRLLTSDMFHYICTSKPSRHTAGPEHNSILVAVPSAALV